MAIAGVNYNSVCETEAEKEELRAWTLEERAREAARIAEDERDSEEGRLYVPKRQQRPLPTMGGCPKLESQFRGNSWLPQPLANFDQLDRSKMEDTIRRLSPPLHLRIGK